MFGVVIPMRKATDRRRAILDLLIKSDKPISKTYLIEVFGVTKNVIDNDISAIRDKGYNVVGFPGHHGGFQLVEHKGSAYAVLGLDKGKRYESICSSLSNEEDRHLLEYVIRIAEMRNIV